MNILAMVDVGEFALDDRIEIPAHEVFPYVSDIARRWPKERRFKLNERLEQV